jgi:hypothetical protein
MIIEKLFGFKAKVAMLTYEIILIFFDRCDRINVIIKVTYIVQGFIDLVLRVIIILKKNSSNQKMQI